MSFYQKIAKIGTRFVAKELLFKYGFNWSPMYRRSSGKIIGISKDMLRISIKTSYTYKTKIL